MRPHLLLAALVLLLATPVAASGADFKGGDCPGRHRHRRAPRLGQDVKAAFTCEDDRNGVIEVRVTKPGTIGAVKRLTVRRGRNPTIATRCLPPGASKPAKC